MILLYILRSASNVPPAETEAYSLREGINRNQPRFCCLVEVFDYFLALGYYEYLHRLESQYKLYKVMCLPGFQPTVYK